MWRRKKVIVGATLAAVLLFGSLGGVALADENDSQPRAVFGDLWDRVLEIYEENTSTAIDQEALKDAFTEARTETMATRLQNMVDEGTMTQDEADQLLEWMQSRPDAPAGFGSRGAGFRGHGGFHGMGGMHGFGGLCPVE